MRTFTQANLTAQLYCLNMMVIADCLYLIIVKYFQQQNKNQCKCLFQSMKRTFIKASCIVIKAQLYCLNMIIIAGFLQLIIVKYFHHLFLIYYDTISLIMHHIHGALLIFPQYAHALFNFASKRYFQLQIDVSKNYCFARTIWICSVD